MQPGQIVYCMQKRKISKDEWNKRLAAVTVRKEDMNHLIMNFLVTEVGTGELPVLKVAQCECRQNLLCDTQTASIPDMVCIAVLIACALLISLHLRWQEERAAICNGLWQRLQDHACLQGFVEAAETFERESGTSPGLDLQSITDRMEIRRAVQGGDIEDAISRVNDLNPEVRVCNQCAASVRQVLQAV